MNRILGWLRVALQTAEYQNSSSFKSSFLRSTHAFVAVNTIMKRFSHFRRGLVDELQKNPGWTAMLVVIIGMITGLYLSSYLPH